MLDEQADEARGLGQQAATVAAQVHDQAVDAFLLQLADQARDIAGRAAVRLIASPSGLGILVEARHVDDADLVLAVAFLDRADLLLRRLRLEGHLVARELDDVFLRARRGACRQDRQSHRRSRRTADLLHHIVQAPADHVDHLARLALADRGDPVVRLQLPADGDGPAGDDVDDRDVVVDELQRGADADVGQLHRDIVFLAGARREIVRMRVVHVGVGVEEGLEHVVGGDLVDALEQPLVALAQYFATVGPALAGEHQGQGVVLDALAPQVVQVLLALEPRRLAAVVGERLVGREVGLRVQHVQRIGHRRTIALLEALEDREGRFDRAGAHRLGELRAVTFELVDIRFQEIAAATVERLQVVIKDLRGELFVGHELAVVRAFEHLADDARHLPFTIAGPQFLRSAVGVDRGDRAQRRGGGEQQADERYRGNGEGDSQEEARSRRAGGLGMQGAVGLGGHVLR